MSVSDGQNVDAAITNAGFMDKNEDTFTVGEVALQNPVPANGVNVDSVQKELNSEASYTGKTINTVENDLPAWVDSTVGTPTDNLRERSDALTTASTANASDIADIRTTTGTADGAVDMGVYSGTLLNDNESAKANIQQLETATEANTASSAANTSDVADIRTTTGTSDGDTNMGVYSGSIISDAESTKQNIQQLEIALESLVTGLTYQGTWNADTNTPTLVSSVGSTGFYYIVDVAGTTNLDGITDWGVGDWAIFADTGVWQKVDNSDQIGANQTLSNLISPTAINQHLVPDSTNARDLGETGSLGWRDVFASGIAYINGGLTAASNGVTKLFSQDQNGIDTGDIEIFTGNATAGESGDITLTIGSASGGAPASEISNTTASSGGHFNGNITTFDYGCTFPTTAGFNLSNIAISVRTTAAATGNAVMEVWGVDGGGTPDPGNVIAISTNALVLSTLTTNYSTETFNFSSEVLSPATSYAYILKDDGAATTGNLAFENGNAVASHSYYYNNPPWFTGGGLDGVYEMFSAAAAIKGDIFLKNGSEGAVGEVWTSKGTLGEGEWALPTGGGSGVGGINYLVDDSFNFEGETVGDWVTYVDAPGVEPDDGIGAGANITLTTTPIALRGSFSGLITKDAANRQGQGVSVPFAIEPADKNSTLFVSFDSEQSAGYIPDDVIPYIYNADTSTLEIMRRSGSGNHFTGNFSTDATSVNYRLIYHIASTNAAAWTMTFDTNIVGPDKTIDFSSDGPIGQLMDFPINLVPDKFLYCDGTPQSRTTYADLFAVVGTQFGVGDGSTTFNLPDYRNVFFRGDSGGRLAGATEADATARNGLTATQAAHNHAEGSHTWNGHTRTYGSFASAGNGPAGTGSGDQQAWTSTSTPAITIGAGDAETRPANTAVKRCIRYAKGVNGVLSTTETLNETGAARFYRNGTQNITVSTPTPIIFNTVDFNDSSIFSLNTITGEVTVNKAGNFQIKASVRYVNHIAEANILSIQINGVATSVQQRTLGVSLNDFDIADTVSLKRGDILTVEVDSNTDVSYDITGASTVTWVSITEVPRLSVYSIYGKTDSVEVYSGEIAYPGTANTWGDLTSIELDEGEWDIDLMLVIKNSGVAGAATNIAYGLGTASGTGTAGLTLGDTYRHLSNPITTNGYWFGGAIPRIKKVVTTPTTYYFKENRPTSVVNLNCVYKITARKVK